MPLSRTKTKNALGPLIVCAVVLAAFAVPASAQQTQSDLSKNLCEFADQSFSEGAVIRLGDVLATCDAAGTWDAPTEVGALCLFAGEFYTVGALISPADTGAVLECRSKGQWEIFKP